MVHDAIVEIGAKSDGDPLTSDEEAGGLRRLKGMLDQWTQDGLLIPQHSTASHIVTESKDTYLFGSTGSMADGSDPDVVIPRPVEEIDVLNYKRVGNENDWPMRLASLRVLEHNHNVNIEYPTMWYFERDWPVARLLFNTRARVGDSFRLHYTSAVNTDFTGDGEISGLFPPGYREAILLNLALKLAPSYGVKDGRASGLSSQTIDGARKALKLIRKRHVQVGTSILDRALVTRRRNLLQGGIGSPRRY